MQKLNLGIDLRGPILVFDAKYLAYRARHSRGLEALSFNDIKTGVLFGFFRTVMTMVKRFKASEMVFMFDEGKVANSRRRHQFSGYKKRKESKDRKYTAEEIKINEIFDKEYKNIFSTCYHLGFNTHSLPKFEADDLIAMFCNRFPNNRIVVVTRDEDIYQCITENVSVFSPDDKVNKDLKWFKDKYGINPDQWHMVKALAGCKSDTVPGIAGIGEGRALDYLKGNATDNIIKKINNDSESIELYKKLVTLPHEDAVYNEPLFRRSNLDIETFTQLCLKNGFNEFLTDIQQWKRFELND